MSTMTMETVIHFEVLRLVANPIFPFQQRFKLKLTIFWLQRTCFPFLIYQIDDWVNDDVLPNGVWRLDFGFFMMQQNYNFCGWTILLTLHCIPIIDVGMGLNNWITIEWMRCEFYPFRLAVSEEKHKLLAISVRHRRDEDDDRIRCKRLIYYFNI